MWSAVGNLASIVTIFGFVITIWQLFALKKSVKKSEQAIRVQRCDVKKINDLKIKSFAIPHDAVNPCGFNISNNEKNISIATDIGHMTKEILKVLEPSDFVLLESNYDPEVLKCSPYPYILKSRIAGPNGHLPNELAGKTIAYLLKCNLKTAMLGHLSKESNFPELAYKTVLDEVIAGNCKEDSLNLSVASRDIPGKLIKI